MTSVWDIRKHITEEAARKHFKRVSVRDHISPAEYFLTKSFGAENAVFIEWLRGEWFLDEYFRGLAEYGDEIWLGYLPDGFVYWCEGAKYRGKRLDNVDWGVQRDNIEAIANMAGNMLDGGLGMVVEADFVERVFFSKWDDSFEPDAVAGWIEGLKGSFGGWRDLGRFRPYYTFDGWGIRAWVKISE